VQVEAITGRDLSDEAFFEQTVESTQRLILASLGLT
jgi:TetR/AcrR family transcriptional regulator